MIQHLDDSWGYFYVEKPAYKLWVSDQRSLSMCSSRTLLPWFYKGFDFSSWTRFSQSMWRGSCHNCVTFISLRKLKLTRTLGFDPLIFLKARNSGFDPLITSKLMPGPSRIWNSWLLSAALAEEVTSPRFAKYSRHEHQTSKGPLKIKWWPWFLDWKPVMSSGFDNHSPITRVDCCSSPEA